MGVMPPPAPGCFVSHLILFPFFPREEKKKRLGKKQKKPEIPPNAGGGECPPGKGSVLDPPAQCRAVGRGGEDFRPLKEPSKSKFKAKEPKRVPPQRGGRICREGEASGAPSEGSDLGSKMGVGQAAMGGGIIK